MADFQMLAPPLTVTDPDAAKAGPGRVVPVVPAHLYKFVSKETDDSMIVAWVQKHAIHNDVLIVATEEALEEALADGWSATPVLKKGKAE